MKSNSVDRPDKSGAFILLFRLARYLFKDTRIQHFRLTSSVYSFLVRKAFSDTDTHSLNFRGLDLIVEGRDITLLPTLIDQTYEKYEIDWFISLIASNSDRKLFIDIGANVGIYATLATRHSEDNVFCVAIEPDPRNLTKLKSNISKNEASERVQILPCAVGMKNLDDNESLERMFLLSQYGATSRLVRIGDRAERGSIESVKIRTLNEIVEDFHNESYDLVVIKIDVEGFEPEVLASGIDSIKTIRPFLLIEYTSVPNRQDTIFWTLDFLAQLFDIYTVVDVIESNHHAYRVNSPMEILAISPSKLVNLIFTP